VRFVAMDSSTPRWLWKLDAEHRLLIAISVMIFVFLALPKSLGLGTRSLVAWDVGVGSLLLLVWGVILTAHPRQIRHRARTDDTNRLVVTIIMLSAASASLFAVLFLLHGGKQLPPAEAAAEIGLSAIAVLCSWFLVHTTLAVRYAHHYYSDMTEEAAQGSDDDPEAGAARGLDFPDEQQPDYLDFAYFSFTIGVAAQVSDVQVTSRLMRQMVLMHSILSFVFNTVVVALSVNIISQLL
jgi:uncharacterized membrane protein